MGAFLTCCIANNINGDQNETGANPENYDDWAKKHALAEDKKYKCGSWEPCFCHIGSEENSSYKKGVYHGLKPCECEKENSYKNTCRICDSVERCNCWQLSEFCPCQRLKVQETFLADETIPLFSRQTFGRL